MIEDINKKINVVKNQVAEKKSPGRKTKGFKSKYSNE